MSAPIITEETSEDILDGVGTTAGGANVDVTWFEANQRYLAAGLSALRLPLKATLNGGTDAFTSVGDVRLDLDVWTFSQPPALEQLCSAFDLSSFERGILLLAAGAEMDSELAAHYASLDASRRPLTHASARSHRSSRSALECTFTLASVAPMAAHRPPRRRHSGHVCLSSQRTHPALSCGRLRHRRTASSCRAAGDVASDVATFPRRCCHRGGIYLGRSVQPCDSTVHGAAATAYRALRHRARSQPRHRGLRGCGCQPSPPCAFAPQSPAGIKRRNESISSTLGARSDSQRICPSARVGTIYPPPTQLPRRSRS